MATEVRLLNEAGEAKLLEYVRSLREGSTIAPPTDMLDNAETSSPASFNAEVEEMPLGRPFSSAYELGKYLCDVLAHAPKNQISHAHGLWNWLSLFYFNSLCPDVDGKREPAEDAAYVLASEYSHQRYYRHIVRSAWHLVASHGHLSKVLLTPGSKHAVPVAVRAEPQMQIGATQRYVESATVVEMAYRLYFDEAKNKLKAGASAKEDGGPRRFVAVLNQFDLTYDLDGPTDALFERLPSEFDRFKEL